MIIAERFNVEIKNDTPYLGVSKASNLNTYSAYQYQLSIATHVECVALIVKK